MMFPTNNEMLDMIIEMANSKTHCKGLFFCGYVKQNKNNTKTKKTLRFLQNKSCPGCVRCKHIWKCINKNKKNPINVFPDIRDGCIYKAIVKMDECDNEKMMVVFEKQ